jgi:hypothetical protein
MSQQAFGNEAVSLEAPDKIQAGKTAIVKLKVAVPAYCKRKL